MQQKTVGEREHESEHPTGERGHRKKLFLPELCCFRWWRTFAKLVIIEAIWFGVKSSDLSNIYSINKQWNMNPRKKFIGCWRTDLINCLITSTSRIPIREHAVAIAAIPYQKGGKWRPVGLSEDPQDKESYSRSQWMMMLLWWSNQFHYESGRVIT